MGSLKGQVESHFGDLSRIQRKLAQTILSDYEEYVFLSVDEAAKDLSVHKSTLVRLAQSLGTPDTPI